MDGRSRFAMIVIIALMALFAFQLLRLQVFQAADTAALGEQTRDSKTTLLAHRGTIYDRNGNVLATSVEVKSVYCDPTLISDLQEEAQDVVSVLGNTIEYYSDIMTTPNSRYVCVARKIPVEQAEKLMDLSLDGFYYEDELDRVYPYGATGGQIIGCLNSDGVGFTGLEQQYDDILAGVNGVKRAQAGVGGAPIPGTVYQQVDPIDGEDIMVSLDIEMQAKLEAEIAASAYKLDAETSTSVLMDAETGEIYAAASIPLFNPADRSIVEPGATDLKSVTNAFEPGSLFKTVSSLAILENKVLTPDDEIECPAELEADEYIVTDAHDRDDVTYSFRDILAYSSNVGIALSVEKLGFTPFYQKIQDYLLTQNTGVDYPNESKGYLLDRAQWSLIQGYNVTFGQGVMVTPLQMTRFYGMIANDGVAVTPHFLIAMPQTGEYVHYENTVVSTDQEALDTVESMLGSVVDYGTAENAAIDGYTVVGKTSTAEIASPDGGYLDGVYNLAFCGYLANSTSKLVCFVTTGPTPYETNVCDPFKAIMEYAIERYKISPK
ncbi:MAG: penicillin-binding protein 2 [Eggerthellales bacterium]|nr:penicillin-binding protein 2 [Eggerthellales bacterium]